MAYRKETITGGHHINEKTILCQNECKKSKERRKKEMATGVQITLIVCMTIIALAFIKRKK